MIEYIIRFQDTTLKIKDLIFTMRIFFGLFFLVFLSISLSGCIYWPTQYYKPSGTGDYSTGWGDYLKSQCGGPDNHVLFEVRDGLAISFLVGRDEKNDTDKVELHSIFILFRLGPGHVLRLSEPTVTVSSVSPHFLTKKVLSSIHFEYMDITSEPIKRNEIFKSPAVSELAKKTVSTHTTSEGKVVSRTEYSIPPSEEFRGGSIPGTHISSFQKFLVSKWQHYNWYRTSIDVTDINLEKFSLRLPVLYFDGNPVTIPDIEIELVDEFVRYPILC